MVTWNASLTGSLKLKTRFAWTYIKEYFLNGHTSQLYCHLQRNLLKKTVWKYKTTCPCLIDQFIGRERISKTGVSVKMPCRLAFRYSSIWFSSIDYLGRRRPLSSSFCSNHKHRHFLSLLDYFTISAYCDRVGTLTLLTWRHGLAVLSNAFRDLAELFVDSQCFRTKYRAVKKIINE